MMKKIPPFLRRAANTATAVPLPDPVPLHDRVQAARDQVSHQHDPALVEVLSARELAANRDLAERIRDHERNEQLARIEATEAAAGRLRDTVGKLADREAKDLIRAARAIAEQRHTSSPHAKVARLHRRKTLVLGILTGVVGFAMLFSAVTVQHNIAPTGGPSNLMWWLSYGLETLISGMLVALMLSTSDTAEWGAIEEPWKVYSIEAVLLVLTITLNIYPYVKDKNLYGIGVHSIAPITIGAALATHSVVAGRYGTAIERATAAVPEHEDLQARLAALTNIGALNWSAGSPSDDTDRTVVSRSSERAQLGLDASFASEEPPEDAEASTDAHSVAHIGVHQKSASGAHAPAAMRADRTAIEPVHAARAEADRAPIARGDIAQSRAEISDPIAIGDMSPIARELPVARAGAETDRARSAHTEEVEGEADRARAARAENVDGRAPIAAHSPADQGTDRDPIAARDDETTPEDSSADDDAARDRRAVVTLVRAEESPRAARGNTDRVPRAARGTRAREAAVDGALARTADRAPIARDAARGTGGSGPFARPMSRAEAERLARAVAERNLSKQPVEILTRIYEAHSQGDTATHIGETIVHLRHSTVLRAIKAVNQVAGPHAVD